MIKKYTTINNNVFLIDLRQTTIQKNNNIISGDSVLLSIYEPDNYYFTEGLNLFNAKNIISTENPDELEISFFKLLKKDRTVKFNKTLINNYGLYKYIHPLPKIKFKQQVIEKNQLEIIGSYINSDEKYKNFIPKITVNGSNININNFGEFKYSNESTKIGDKIEFLFETDKTTYKRTYTVK